MADNRIAYGLAKKYGIDTKVDNSQGNRQKKEKIVDKKFK